MKEKMKKKEEIRKIYLEFLSKWKPKTALPRKKNKQANREWKKKEKGLAVPWISAEINKERRKKKKVRKKTYQSQKQSRQK